MKVARSIADVRSAVAPLRAGGLLGFVPTMGALHEGHTALLRTARAECAAVVASLFVNPTQFTDALDLATYPRSEAADRTLAGAAGVDVLFIPSVEEIYPPGFSLSVQVGGPAIGLEEMHRPGHFRGVATVCLKLFAIIEADVVFLGQKDAQQVSVLRQLVRDVNLDVAIRVVPTVRDRDGLAFSSRNAALSPAERERAQVIPAALRAGLAAYRRGADPARAAREALSIVPIDYATVAVFDDHPTLVVAVRVGRTRLIDNVPLDDPHLAGLEADGSTAGVGAVLGSTHG